MGDYRADHLVWQGVDVDQWVDEMFSSEFLVLYTSCLGIVIICL